MRKEKRNENWLLRLLICLVSCLSVHALSAQYSSLRIQRFINPKDTLTLDSLTIYPKSLVIYCIDGEKISVYHPDDYEVNIDKNYVVLHRVCSDTLILHYRVIPINLRHVYGYRDSSIIYSAQKGQREKFLIQENYEQTDLFGTTSINKNGSISRGVSFGNNQNLAVNSSLNLELSGDIAPNLKLLASVSDNNIPIQADGNTNKLQEFDQIFIQVYNDRMKLVMGDFWLRKPTGYFMSYRKRGQGLTVEYQWGKDTLHKWYTQFSTAISKGKFNRQIIQGVEGNQGPYRLVGAENEPYIIILSGTENVYIDGKLLKRGQENDYVINYNTAELTFTARNQITKDVRIVVEYQYSALNYTRSLMQSSTSYTSKKMDFWLNAYSEQDLKNQPLQQDLSTQQKLLLASVGDDLNKARTFSIDSVGYLENQNLYALVDSLGYDSVLVYSTSKNTAFYKATFMQVGAGQGDYVLDKFGPFGKIYKWVEPIGGVHQGDYAPVRLIYAPQQKQLVASGFTYRFSARTSVETELAYSTNDVNTFSTLDGKNDEGVALKSKVLHRIPIGKKDTLNRTKWLLECKGELEALNRNFSPIEQYRAVEFDRDWNTRNKGFTGNQYATGLGFNFKHQQKGNLAFEGQYYGIGSDYTGYKGKTSGRWMNKKINATWDVSLLSSQSTTKNEFIRHKIDVSRKIKKLKIGYKDDHEYNIFQANSILQLTSYQFFDYQFYLAKEDSIRSNYKFFYRERFDQRSDSNQLVNVAKAQTIGFEWKVPKWKNQSLTFITNYRQLKVLNSTLLNQTPENSLLGRIDYELRAWKGALVWNNFYEVGSGLELKKEIVYVKVNDGQGVYTWIDYNNDGVKDLNEFEIAQFVDQASYIRIFSPSNQYIKTYSNEFNQGLFWKPEKIWANKKQKMLRLFSRFSDQARFRINRKVSIFQGWDAFNPFAATIQDLNLISMASTAKNTLFFNRSSTIFGAEYTIQETRNKTLLASGFDSKQVNYQEVLVRYNIKRQFTLESTYQTGRKISKVDYTTGRNYDLLYYYIKPSIIFQPNTFFRISLDGRYAEKQNSILLGGEHALIKEMGSTFKFNKAEKGSLQGAFNVIHITYTGNQFSALGFEMLEALKPGMNYTWNIGYQRSLSQKMQISFQYLGRKSLGNRVIHTGGMEVRAFF